MIQAILSRKRLVFAVFIILDILLIGMGMGVPILPILFGMLVGWYLPLYLELPEQISKISLKKLLKAALILGAIWLPALSWLFDPAKDLTQFGMPLIFFEPRASFIGWIILMVLISPFLQFLMTVLGAVVRLACSPFSESNQ
jgi:hypothetical protein